MGKEEKWVKKILGMFVFYFLLAVISQIVVTLPFLGILNGWRESGNHAQAYNNLFNIIIGVSNIMTCIGLVLFYKFLYKEPVRGMGLCSLKKGWKDLVRGLLLGAFSMSILAVIFYITGSMKVVSIGFSINLLPVLFMFITVGFIEEILTRGIMQHGLYKSHKIWLAILLPSVIFGALHLSNPNISIIAIINIILVGIVFAIFTYRTGNLYLVIGYHITWNFFQGNVFGIAVSGTDTNAVSIIKGELVKPNILNGGAFGAEGGLICTILLIGTIILQYMYLQKRELPEDGCEL